MNRAQSIILTMAAFMMLAGFGVAGAGVWDGINGPEVPPQPTVVQAKELIKNAPNPEQPVIVQPPEDESQPSDLIGPGLTLAGSGGAIGATALGVGASGGGAQPAPEQEPIRTVVIRDRVRSRTRR
jgi:hypothetical protein